MDKRQKNLSVPVLLVLALLIVFSAVFFIVLVSFSPSGGEGGAITADSYRQELAALPDEADPTHGEALFATYGCAACHDSAASTGVAPAMDGIVERAGEGRPPLTAEAYIYESIIHPGAYLVEGYSNVMPANFRERLSDQDLADMIAYLMTR